MTYVSPSELAEQAGNIAKEIQIMRVRPVEFSASTAIDRLATAVGLLAEAVAHLADVEQDRE